MCGIAGWLGGDVDLERARTMRNRLRHRGPDDSGEWHDPEAGVWLGHRRLAILDLSSTGHQPMLSRSGRYVIVFNGEVFNFSELRMELEAIGASFAGHSDTEVMLAAIDAWGLKAALSRFVGMFAFALWDRQAQSLTLARDRMGIKPLYYASANSHFAFASELCALAPLPWIDATIDQEALADYLRYLCVPAPHTILRGVRKLEPGTLLVRHRGDVRLECYWSLHAVAQEASAHPLKLDFIEAADELEARLRNAIDLRMRSDVPYGAFLSGGVDSSLVAALMCQQSATPPKTFTIGFAGSSNDESGHARAVAAHLGTRHHEEMLEPGMIPALVDEMVTLHDEPFADGSSFPTYLLCRFARRHVTVALSGDGGDELYGGYPRYFWAGRIQRWRARLGSLGTRLAAKALHGVPDGVWNGLVNRLLGGRYSGSQGLAARVHRFAGYLAAGPNCADAGMLSAWPDPAAVLESPPQPARERYCGWEMLDWAEQMMAVDQAHYLPDDILTKVDRTSMAVSMEVRVPMLDHRLVEWSWRVPRAFKLAESGDRGKLLLREVLYRHVPKALIERPKMGFGMPMEHWLRGSLRSWAEDIVPDSSLISSGLLKPSAVREVWQAHLSGENRLPQIWTVLMLQLWLTHWRKAAQP
ncbi:MAG: asparagine synthase (glutamine-hydrolyzing) [Azoarcus sp.]|jgi:asparagine synthase (glutamine-hydrolysing)|nr:asparagine synthase (glutamine-hydrolyzing) [Azoarcus sp.]